MNVRSNYSAVIDSVVSTKYWALNWAGIGRFGLRHSPFPIWSHMRQYPWLRALLKANELHGRMTKTRTGVYREANAFLIHHIIESIVKMLEGWFRSPDRSVLHEDLVPPELFYGMGLNPWMVEFLGIMLPMVQPDHVEPYIDVAENEGIPPDVCSLPKSTVGMVLQDHMPKSAALVTSNMPCDGGMSQYTLIERHLKIPAFRLDVPFHFYGERAVEYFARQLRRLVVFLETHTPAKMDWDRLREVCEERNLAMAYEYDLWDLLQYKPAPLAAEPVYLSHLMFGIAQPGTTRATLVFKKMAELAEKNASAGKGALDDEKVRVALWNPPTLIFTDLWTWAEQKYGAALIMDMLTYHRHPFIDTSTPESMLRGLAQTMMQGPMARHTRGPAENFFSDLFHLYERFDLDTIWMAGHIGCKNTQALNGMFREQCRKRSIPLLIIDYDLSDTRVVSPAGIRNQVAQFMETVM